MSNVQDILNEIKLKITELSDTITNESWVTESNSAAKKQLAELHSFSKKFSSNASTQANINAQPLLDLFNEEYSQQLTLDSINEAIEIVGENAKLNTGLQITLTALEAVKSHPLNREDLSKEWGEVLEGLRNFYTTHNTNKENILSTKQSKIRDLINTINISELAKSDYTIICDILDNLSMQTSQFKSTQADINQLDDCLKILNTAKDILDRISLIGTPGSDFRKSVKQATATLVKQVFTLKNATDRQEAQLRLNQVQQIVTDIANRDFLKILGSIPYNTILPSELVALKNNLAPKRAELIKPVEKYVTERNPGKTLKNIVYDPNTNTLSYINTTDTLEDFEKPSMFKIEYPNDYSHQKVTFTTSNYVDIRHHTLSMIALTSSVVLAIILAALITIATGVALLALIFTPLLQTLGVPALLISILAVPLIIAFFMSPILLFIEAVVLAVCLTLLMAAPIVALICIFENHTDNNKDLEAWRDLNQTTNTIDELHACEVSPSLTKLLDIHSKHTLEDEMLIERGSVVMAVVENAKKDHPDIFSASRATLKTNLSHARSPYSMYPSSAQDSSIETDDPKKGYEKR